MRGPFEPGAAVTVARTCLPLSRFDFFMRYADLAITLLPPPTFRERRHRGLARRLLASARAYVGFCVQAWRNTTSPSVIARAAGP